MKRLSNKELVDQLRMEVYLRGQGSPNLTVARKLIDEIERRLCPQPTEKPASEKQ